MSALIRVLVPVIVIVALATPAFAERVLVADPDPELQRAVKAALAPWKLEVVASGDARYVVSRENGELVVLDRVTNERQQRAAPDGPLDPASAAAAALTVKTLLRLQEDRPQPPTVVAAVVDEPSSTELRIQAGLATRINASAVGVRAGGAVLVKPSRWPLRIGIAGELGTAHDIKDSGFRGAWRDWSVLAIASWTIDHGRWEIEPFAGTGIAWSSLDGDEGMMARHEHATYALARAGASLRRRIGAFTIGGAVAVDGAIGTPAYTRNGAQAEFFAVHAFGASIGVIVASDLGR